MTDQLPPAPAVQPISPSSAWFGGAQLGLTFGGSSIARGPDQSLRYTVIPLAVQPAQEITMQHRADAVSATYTGYLQLAVDLYRLTVERNGFMTGVLDTMAGILGFPLAWQGGSPEMISALADQDGTPGDYSRMHPRNECAKIFRDGLGLGFGLGQYLLMCWRCDGVEWNRESGESAAHNDVEICRTCGAKRTERPIVARELFQLRWRDARWLWRNPVTLQWYYTGRQAMVPVNPGDGEWFLFRTVPDQDIWVHGPWTFGTESAILSRDAKYDEANTAAVCAPTHVFKATQTSGTDPKTRKDVEAQAEQLRFGNKLVLPGEWDHRIDAAKSEFVDVCSKIENRSSDEWEVALTGNKMGQQSGTGFANMDTYQRVTTKRRTFYAGAWIEQIRAQGLTWYTISNFGTRNAPVGVIDCESPEEKLARSTADEAEGKALASLHDGLDALGYELEPAYIVERMQRKGIRVRPQPGQAPRLLEWDATVQAGFVTLNEARADRGYPPVPQGEMMVSASLKPGGDKTPVGATPTPPPAASPGAPAPPAQPPAAAPPAATDARLEAGEDLDDLDIDDMDDDEIRARDKLAADYTAAGCDRCPFHGRTHACQRCGVQREYRLDPATLVPVVAWRAIRRASRARLAAVDPTIAKAMDRLDSALVALEEAGGATALA